jgi:serine/threonine protein kinase
MPNRKCARNLRSGVLIGWEALNGSLSRSQLAYRRGVSRSNTIQPGTLLDGRYRLRALLGEGGMGRVFEGEDIQLSRPVAIKVLHDDGSDRSLAERLFREAKAAARSDHPAIVTTYSYGIDSELGRSYVVMERLQGETLSDRIERVGSLPFELVIRIARDLADALIAVHTAGVIHRDLKPSNVFLTSRARRVDEVKLLDFGVAKQLDLDSLTTTGQIYGTPMYMAPEQLADSKRADVRCDIYAFGTILFECVTARPPFNGRNTAALAVEITFGDQPDPCAYRANIPEDLVAVIQQCMQKRPRDRFQSADALSKALSGV